MNIEKLYDILKDIYVISEYGGFYIKIPCDYPGKKFVSIELCTVDPFIVSIWDDPLKLFFDEHGYEKLINVLNKNNCWLNGDQIKG